MGNSLSSFRVFCAIFLSLSLIQACVRQPEAVSGEIRTFSSGNLYMAAHRDAPRTIYVDVRDKGGAVSSIPREIAVALARGQFRLADSPSKAGYILHIDLLRAGTVDAANLQRLVNSGYGSDAAFSGSGSTGLLADALLVQRRVPSSSRPSRARLKNITKRNALGSGQMRIGLLVPGRIPQGQTPESFFSRVLAGELENALEGGSRADASDDPQ